MYYLSKLIFQNLLLSPYYIPDVVVNTHESAENKPHYLPLGIYIPVGEIDINEVFRFIQVHRYYVD